MLKFLTFALSIVILSSCGNQQEKEKAEFDALFAEVMVLHDDVMPETNNLYKLKKYAQENIATLPDTSVFVKKLMDVQLKSEKADEAMMEWMANFKIPEGDHQAKMEYLANEKISITKVRDLMLSTLHTGKEVIRKSDKYIKKNKLRDDLTTTFTPNN